MQFLMSLIMSMNAHFSPIDSSTLNLLNNSLQKVTQASAQHVPNCEKYFHAAEDKYGIPRNLLRSVARVESGRWDNATKKSRAWPWTILVNGKRPQAFYFKSKDEAHKKIKKLEEQGIKNIDIGVMQVNNIWHGDAFSDHHEALDPEANIEYAAKHIKELYNKSKSWIKAVGYYHSHNPRHSVPYRQRVMRVWGKDRPVSIKCVINNIVAKKSKRNLRTKKKRVRVKLASPRKGKIKRRASRKG